MEEGETCLYTEKMHIISVAAAPRLHPLCSEFFFYKFLLFVAYEPQTNSIDEILPFNNRKDSFAFCSKHVDHVSPPIQNPHAMYGLPLTAQALLHIRISSAFMFSLDPEVYIVFTREPCLRVAT